MEEKEFRKLIFWVENFPIEASKRIMELEEENDKLNGQIGLLQREVRKFATK